MAFNPFHAFRKHQKVIFAGLTILCMVTFILTGSLTGRGDFFDWLITSMGGQGKLPQIATLYGKKLTQLDINALRDGRLLANEYMAIASQQALLNIMQALRSGDKGSLNQELQGILQLAAIPGFYQQSSRNQLLGMMFKLQNEGKKDEAT